jgi:ABC-type multidrug transport system ATPase subunit
LLDQVGLAHLADERVGQLSRGQQQRVTIARALLHDPPVLLLDEPDTGLDVAAFDVLEAMVTAQPRTVVLTTHNLVAGLRLGSRAAVLSHGRIAHERAALASTDAPELSELLQQLAAA